MLYNVMEPRFIFFILLWGALACAALAAAVLSLYQRGAQSPYLLRSLSFFFAACGFAALFVSVTAYQKSLLVAAYASSCVLFAAAVALTVSFVVMIIKKRLPLFAVNANFGKVIDAIDDPFIIYDASGIKIAGAPSPQKEFDQYQKAAELLALTEVELYKGAIKEHAGRYYSVTLSDIRRGRRVVGRVLLFNDITEKHLLMQSIETYNKQLKQLNDVLEGEAAVDEDIFYQRERARIANDLEKRVGAGIRGILAEADAAAGETDQQKQADNFTKLAADIRALLADIRQIVHTGTNP